MMIYDKIKDMGGWLTPAEADFLYNLAKNTKNKGEIVEIGSWKGRSTVCLAYGSKEAFGKKVHAIDPHVGSPEHRAKYGEVDTFAEFKDNIRQTGVEDMVEPIRGYSYEISPIFDRPIELLFIDGAHEYEDVLRDYLEWMPKVIDGGIIAFHDSTGGRCWTGPARVVNEYVFSGKNFKNTGFTDSISYGVKVSKNTILDRARNKRILVIKKIFGLLRKIFGRIEFLSPLKGAFKAFFKAIQK